VLSASGTVYDLSVTYEITVRGYKGGTDNVRITEGYTTVQDIPKMIAMRRKVSPARVKITLIRELTA
jgi:hypothetical protein